MDAEAAVRLIKASFPGAEEIGPPRALAKRVIEPTAERGTCSYPERHGAAHRPHPTTGRPICSTCHPPAGARR
jgi:hypothetical protein